MKNIKIITLSFVSLLLLFTLFGVPRSNDSVAAAATCYVAAGPRGTLFVEPKTITCPSVTTTISYYDSSGAPFTDNPATLPATRCFVQDQPVSGARASIFREGTCKDLELLRTTTARARCEEGGGTYTQRYNDSRGTTEASCTCSGNKTVDSSGRCAFVESKPTAAPKYVEGDCQTGPNESLNEGNCGIIRYLVIIINLLSALVGVVIVGSIIWAGIQYSMAGSDPQKVSAAKDRIRNALIALFFFLFMYGLLNYLVPGGVL
jgi:hypothetical protein